MNYIKSDEEQNKLISKVEKIYRKDQIILLEQELSSLFKYGVFIDETMSIWEESFFKTLYDLCVYTNDNEINIFSTDKEYIRNSYTYDNYYPSVNISIKDLENSNEVLKLMSKFPSEDEPFFISGTNLCIIPSSFQWIFSLNRYYTKVGCFASNNLEIMNIFKNSINTYENRDVILTKRELINDYNFAKNEKEFDLLPIGKLEII